MLDSAACMISSLASESAARDILKSLKPAIEATPAPATRKLNRLRFVPVFFFALVYPSARVKQTGLSRAATSTSEMLDPHFLFSDFLPACRDSSPFARIDRTR
jgi:hypothetical protein